MNNKEVNDPRKTLLNSNSDDLKESDEVEWLYCPFCGIKLPKVNKLKFCIGCGNDIDSLKNNRQLKPRRSINPYIKSATFPQTSISSFFLGSKKISDEEIINPKNHELWGTQVSIGIPLGAFLLMNFISAGLLVLLTFFSFDINFLFDLVSNPYFLILSSFFELTFIILPVVYVEKYLQNPTLKNRLALLGFTSKGLNRHGLLKEIIIGLGFAFVGIILVGVVSFLTEIVVELFFGIEIIRDINSAPTDVEIIISSADITSLILLSIVMILIIGTSEEILFRGFMQKGLMRSLGNRWGIIITAFIFSIIHVLGFILMVLDSPLILFVSLLLSFFPYFMISLMLGLLFYWRNENLIAVIIAHGVYDALAIILAYLLYYTF
ncbi:MAG: lysostaphin resistance A-like protein [Candidatus Thorarchaeota archaeon]